ncbi:hypothetical protein PFISCL1PPCAC_4077, partial [Pristionchus fissidentatus]
PLQDTMHIMIRRFFDFLFGISNATNDSAKVTHASFNHSSFPDAKVLQVRRKNFVVSSSYLSLHSPFFYDFFLNANANEAGLIELDADPLVFSDLLNIIYPTSKVIDFNAVDLNSPIIEVLSLALRLKVRYAVKTLLIYAKDNSKVSDNEIMRTMIQHNAFDSYKFLFTSPNLYDELMPTTGVVRDDSDNLVPIVVSPTFADAVQINVEGIKFLVSSS